MLPNNYDTVSASKSHDILRIDCLPSSAARVESIIEEVANCDKIWGPPLSSQWLKASLGLV